MELNVALAIARHHLSNHGLENWNVRINGRLQGTLGKCKYSSQVIELGRAYVLMNGRESVEKTILHEIAHALVGPGHGHDIVWKAMALRLGIEPKACATERLTLPGRWKATCSCAGQVHIMFRRPRRKFRCARCRVSLVYSDT